MSEEEPQVASQLPKPTGYKILIALPEPDKTFDGGIVKASKTLYEEEIGSIVGVVLKLGPEFRLINDDSVEAVVEDPRGIVKA